MNFLLKQSSSLVVVARPAPHILTVAVGSAGLQNGGCEDPHDGAKDKETNGIGRIVDCHLLRSSVSTSVVAPEDD